METSCGLCVSESQRNKIFCPHTFLTSYRSFIAPYLTYGLVAWGQASKSSLDEQLLKLQKRVLCFIYFSNHNEHAIPLFADANFLPLIFSYYRYESIAKLMCDMEFHQTVPKLYLNTVSGMHQYNTQSSESQNFLHKHSELSIDANSFSRIGAKLWNEIWNSLPLHSQTEFLIFNVWVVMADAFITLL